MDPAEDEAALLAELRAISNKSASVDRFATSSSEEDGGSDDGRFPNSAAAPVNDDGKENDGSGVNISSATTTTTTKSTTGIQNTDQNFQDAKTASPEPSTALVNDVTGAEGLMNTTEAELSPSQSPSFQSSPPPNKDENINTTITTDEREKAIDGGGCSD